jgi:AraC-like DNA-binding protein
MENCLIAEFGLQMNNLYNIISIFMGGSVFLTFGICFLFLTVAETPLLRNYLTARRIVACAYLFLAFSNVVEYLSRSPEDNIQLTQMVTLVIGCSQSFLFTYVFITLINPQFLSGRKMSREVSLFLLFIAALFAGYFLCPAEWSDALFAAYALIYAFLIVRFTRMFLTNYRRYTFQMDNYYAGEEARHLQWVRVSFFVALTIGVLAFLNALFMSEARAVFFSVVLIVFYITFAIRFLNYPFEFCYIEQVISNESEEEIDLSSLQEPVADNSIEVSPQQTTSSTLEEQIEQWIADKRFTKTDITLDTLATCLRTNNKYLSIYINTRKKQTFREWINQLRIEEAKNLLRQYPDKTINEIARLTGFSDKSNFIRQFRKQTNLSPTNWKNKQQ